MFNINKYALANIQNYFHVHCYGAKKCQRYFLVTSNNNTYHKCKADVSS